MSDQISPGPPVTAGAVDLLGVLAYGELSAFDRLAEDARMAPSLADTVQMVAMAAAQFEHFRLIESRLAELNADVLTAMSPFHRPFDSFHAHTAPKTWLEGLVKAYVGDGLAGDFYREIAAFVDPETRAVVNEALAEEAQAEFVVERVRAGITAQPDVAGRLALWARRLVGEALSQAQRVAADRTALTDLLTGSREQPGMDLALVGQLFSRLVENHTKRMARLGLQS